MVAEAAPGATCRDRFAGLRRPPDDGPATGARGMPIPGGAILPQPAVSEASLRLFMHIVKNADAGLRLVTGSWQVWTLQY